MTYKEIIEKVARDNNLPIDLVDNTYKSFWLFIRNTIQELPLKDNLTKEEFSKLRTNFNIPSIGKLCLSYDRYKGIKERFKFIKTLRDNGKAETN